MSFKLTLDHPTSSSLVVENLFSQRKFLVYVHRPKSFVDFRAFNEKNENFGYDDVKRRDNVLQKREELKDWGTSIFSWNNIKANKNRFYRNTRLSDEKLADDQERSIHIQSESCVRLTLNAYLCKAAIQECKRSEIFLKNFLRYIQVHYRRKRYKINGEFTGRASETSAFICFPLLIAIKLLEPRKETYQLAWDERIHQLVAKKGYMEDAMSWLNTLGGGYSALGDYFTHHAKEAGKISLRQMKVALEMGDPPTVIRCHLYFGLSLMQCGHLRRAKYIIRHQSRVAKKIAASDHRLRSSCLGLWARLRYLYHLRSVARRQTCQ